MKAALGFFNRPWIKAPLAQELDGIAATGSRHLGLLGRPGGGIVVDWDMPMDEIAQLKDMIAERGLKLHAVLARVHFDVSLEESISRYRRFMDRAVALGAAHLLEMGAHDPAKYDFYFQVIGAVCDYAADKGLTIGIKPHGGLTTSGKETAEVVERVNHEAFRMWYDPGNILYYKQLDPVAEAQYGKDMVVGVCVKDCIIGPDGKPSVQVTPGEGQVDFPAVFRALVDGGFKGGPCLVETLGPEEPDAVTEAGKKTVQYIKSVMSQAGLEVDLG